MKRGTKRLHGALVAGAVLAASLLAALALLTLTGRDGGQALASMAAGAFGGPGRIATTLLRATPLVLAGLAVAVAFRAGVWNIGAEGQLVAGALAAAWAGTRAGLASGPFGPVAALAIAAAFGGAVGAIAGALRAFRGVPEVLSTILLNFLAYELRSWAVTGPLREAAGQYPQTDAVLERARLGAVGVVPWGLLVGGLAAVAIHLALARTRTGLAVRAAGASPRAARACGVSLGAVQVGVLAVSGALAGLAGGAEVLGSIHRIHEGYAPGYGFTAIAVALLARLSPLLVVPSGLVFGAIAAGSESLQRAAGVPSALGLVVQALVICGCVVAWPATAARGRGASEGAA